MSKFLDYDEFSGCSVVECFRALDGPWFKSSTLLLSGFVLGSPEFNSSTALCKHRYSLCVTGHIIQVNIENI